MRKVLAILGMVLVILCADGRAGNVQNKKNGQQPPAPVSPVIKQQQSGTNCQNENQEYVHADVKIVNPPEKDFYDKAPMWVNLALGFIGAIGIAIGIRSLCILKRQTLAAWASAKAALRQSRHIVVSERAWIIAVPSDPQPPLPESNKPVSLYPHSTSVLIKFLNKGKTPAFLGEISTGACAISIGEMPDLAPLLISDDLGGMPLVPEQPLPWNHPRITIPKAISIRTGELFLWIYGTIQYGDAFGQRRKTRFCFRWEPVNESGVSEWIMDGPEGSNRAT